MADLASLKTEHDAIQDEQGSLADQGYSADDAYMILLEKKRLAVMKKINALKKGVAL